MHGNYYIFDFSFLHDGADDGTADVVQIMWWILDVNCGANIGSKYTCIEMFIFIFLPYIKMNMFFYTIIITIMTIITTSIFIINIVL